MRSLSNNSSMVLKISGDPKHQSLRISFTFDQHQEDKLIINAIVDHTTYQLELVNDFDLDSDQVKNTLLSKKFKILSRSP